MPNRLLREGILDSEAVNGLTWPAEVFYRRLMSAVDDFGRFDARPAVLRSRLYPLKIDQVREADISRWIAECEKAGLIVLYAVESRAYILFSKFNQQVRAKVSKFPPPPQGKSDGDAQHVPSTRVADAKHVPSTCVADAQHMLPETETETEADTPAPQESASGPRAAPPPPAVAGVAKAKKPRAVPDTAHHHAVAAFREGWAGRYGGEAYPFTEKDFAAVKWVLDQLGRDADKFRAVLGRYFATEDEFVAKQGHSLSYLRSSLPRWLTDAGAKSGAAPTRGQRADAYAIDVLTKSTEGSGDGDGDATF